MNEASTGMMAVMALHAFFCLLLFFAGVAAVAWMARFASKAELKKTFWTCLLLGAVGSILTGLVAGPRMMKDWDDHYEGMDEDEMEERMDEMMDTSDEAVE